MLEKGVEFTVDTSSGNRVPERKSLFLHQTDKVHLQTFLIQDDIPFNIQAHNIYKFISM